jgi:hypothetical protein
MVFTCELTADPSLIFMQLPRPWFPSFPSVNCVFLIEPLGGSQPRLIALIR